MTFQLDEMRAIGGPVVRVVVAETKGSVPREVGASMLIHRDGITGTIGGGALEFEAIRRARDVLETGQDRFDRVPLGPGLGQCCGGAVALLTERWKAESLDGLRSLVARPLPSTRGPEPLSVKRIQSAARNAGQQPVAELRDGWMIEPILHPDRDIWIWGAGHVGRALVSVLAPLPNVKLRWADTDQSRFPSDVPAHVDVLIAEAPTDLITLSKQTSEHLVLTYSHALDFEICHRVLERPFRSLGLIGSATKRARFRKRLAELGHTVAQIDRMQCPIGDPSLGKHPQMIAIGVATELLRTSARHEKVMEDRA